jgi:hypothetical protein
VRRSLVVFVACVGGSAGACGRTPTQESPAPTASATIARSAGAIATAAPIASWQGSYTSVAGAMTLPKDVRWRVPETPEGLGVGTLALTVDPASGRVRGTVEGPLGPATLDGMAADGRLTASMARRDPNDRGFIGTLSGDVTDGGVRGTMNVALAEASALRTASFQLAPVRGAESPH